jgi:helicase SWR1
VAEGPTSFVENGRRKSGRTNIVPLELQPQSKKRQTRAAVQKVVEDKVKQNRPLYNYSSSKSNVELTGRPMSAGKSTRPKSPVLATKRPSVKEEFPPSKHAKIASSPSQSRSQQGRDSAKPSRQLAKSSTFTRQRTPSSISNATHSQSRHVNGYDPSDEEDGDGKEEQVLPAFGPKTKLQRITFRVKLPKPAIQSPGNLPAPKKYSSFQEFLEKDEIEPKAGDGFLSLAQTLREARARMLVQKAKKRGQALDKKLNEALPDPQKEPDRQWAHYDHLIAHVRHFRRLVRAEHQTHKRQAKKIAEEAVKYLEAKHQKNKVKTAEEIEQEEVARVLDRCKAVVKDLERQWSLVEAEVNRFRQAQWEQQQQAIGKEHLNRVLEQHTQMLESRIARDSSDIGSEDDQSRLGSGSSTSTSDVEDDSNMSSDDSETEDDRPVEDDDEGLTREELVQKYIGTPVTAELDSDRSVAGGNKALMQEESMQKGADITAKVESEVDSLIASANPSATTPTDSAHRINDLSEGVEDSMLDDSDPSINMDSDITDSSSGGDDGSDEDAEDNSNDQDDEDDIAGTGLLGFISKSELAAAAAATALDASMEDASGEESAVPEQLMTENHVTPQMEVDDPSVEMPQDEATGQNEEKTTKPDKGELEGRASQEASTEASPRTSATKASDVESVSSVDPQAEVEHPPTPSATKSSTIKTPVPSLLRGTLREYQHEGLDWLADLYANNRNGILADEMGLGKTIQSIALLAHLAVKHEVWGPHLIIVPTSVMLNWEMEFKKFCPGFKILTYYGTQEERRQKRRGWQRDDLWNVCITSYQLVLQDQTVFKRRNWHYMILDEAHNIKNFRSQRWQTMLTFKTRARLLLTGTPLQNNLTELWSLLFFLRPTDTAEDEDEAFAGLADFSDWFRKPVHQILEYGRDAMDDEGKEQVTKLHKVIRPYLLRRLKADVEKQMPAKYEHVELCRLSKRQRQLYDGFMSRAQTKETLASGNYLSIINCLMQLRKVCNHPDLFETRPITTSFAMSKSAVADFEIRDLLVRRRLMQGNNVDKGALEFLQLVPISREDKSAIEVVECSRLIAFTKLQALREAQYRRTNWQMKYNGSSTSDVLASLENIGRQSRMAELERALYCESQHYRQRPIYGTGLLKKLTIIPTSRVLSQSSANSTMLRSWDKQIPVTSSYLVQSILKRSMTMEPLIQKFACITPAVVATDMAVTTLSEVGAAAIREQQQQWPKDPFHEPRTRLSIAFPDKRLLQYDCGKLQRLDRLLRDLQAGGHRALIFTQMTKVLDILEQFLNIHGHRYLRLDGATKIEQRQILTDRFNNDNRILAFILSSRSGGLGINLTGADTVIFYDLDWNPAMDKQCQDRCHRIGQTRDVHIYRFVSEHTIESNILRKANQKRMLDDVVIQEGDFTTDYLNKLSVRDMLGDDVVDGDAEASAAMDRVLGSRSGMGFEQVEDREDIAAARVAEKEVQHADDGDFEDVVTSHDPSVTPRTPGALSEGPLTATNAAFEEVDEKDRDNDGFQHIDEYMLRLKKWLLADVPIMPLAMKNKRSKKKGGEHRTKRVR